MLGLDIDHHDDHTVVVVRGDVTLSSLPQLRTGLIDAVQQGSGPVQVDLSQVSFIDSAGLGGLIGGLKRARSQGRDLTIAATSPRVQRVLEVTDLDRVFRCEKAVTGS